MGKIPGEHKRSQCVFKVGLNKYNDGLESLSSFEYVEEEQNKKEVKTIFGAVCMTKDSMSHTKQDPMGSGTLKNPSTFPLVKERKGAGPNRKLCTRTRAKTRRNKTEDKGCVAIAKNKDGNFKNRSTITQTKVENRNNQKRHDKVKTKMKAIETLIENDKELQDSNFESWTKGPNLTENAKLIGDIF